MGKVQKKRRKAKPVKLSRLHKPDDLSLEDWQRELRRQFGREQKYTLRNLGTEPFFSEFAVANPQSRRTYCVRIRGLSNGDNHCTCPDFATNTLGTCKHIEFALSRLERKTGGRAALKAGWIPPYSEIYLHYGPQREVRFRPGSDCSPQLARLVSRYFDSSSVLSPESFAAFDQLMNAAGKLDEELRCHDDVRSYVAEVRDAEERRRKTAEAFPNGIRSEAFKGLLKVNLYDYQREGALFAASAGRCLIGDEMGLGKTIQAIAAAEIMAKLHSVARVLIVCPTSLKHQWQREIDRFSTRSVEVVGGMRSSRQEGFTRDSFFKVINYDTIHSDLDLIQNWSPDLVILDEAQRIKNWDTRTARSVKQILSPYAIVLTGTPLENRLEELVSIVQFVDRFRLGPTFRLLHEHQVRDEVGKVIGYKNLDRIGATLEPVLIRRHKQQVLEQLPERIDQHVFVTMTKEQRECHTEGMELVARIVQKWRRYKFLSEADRQKLMIALQKMRMSCDSTFLVDHVSDFGVKADEITMLLDEQLEEKGSKVVIFSQWQRMLELLTRRLDPRGHGFVSFTGSVPSAKRKELIDRFRDDAKCRLFLSTDAGGTGLNLQHASMVINADLPWNPAVLEQRIGRVHRLGQKKAVRVVNYVAKGTIEEGMLSVLQFKRSLFAGVLDGGESDVFMGGSKLTKFMETVEKVTTAVPSAPDEEREIPEPIQIKQEAQANQPIEEIHEPSVVNDPWSGLLQAGMALLQQLATPGTNSQARGGSSLIQRDERTGESYVRLPMPSPDVLEQVLQGVGALLEGLKRGGKS